MGLGALWGAGGWGSHHGHMCQGQAHGSRPVPLPSPLLLDHPLLLPEAELALGCLPPLLFHPLPLPALALLQRPPPLLLLALLFLALWPHRAQHRDPRRAQPPVPSWPEPAAGTLVPEMPGGLSGIHPCPPAMPPAPHLSLGPEGVPLGPVDLQRRVGLAVVGALRGPSRGLRAGAPGPLPSHRTPREGTGKGGREPHHPTRCPPGWSPSPWAPHPPPRDPQLTTSSWASGGGTLLAGAAVGAICASARLSPSCVTSSARRALSTTLASCRRDGTASSPALSTHSPPPHALLPPGTDLQPPQGILAPFPCPSSPASDVGLDPDVGARSRCGSQTDLWGLGHGSRSGRGGGAQDPTKQGQDPARAGGGGAGSPTTTPDRRPRLGTGNSSV